MISPDRKMLVPVTYAEHRLLILSAGFTALVATLEKFATGEHDANRMTWNLRQLTQEMDRDLAGIDTMLANGDLT